MSTANKLTYLNTTKGKIKSGINRLGGSLTSESTFRNYATELDNLYDAMPKVTDEGSSLSLAPTRKGGLSIIPKGACEQDSYSGKNFLGLPNGTRTNNGITAINTYNEIVLNGTSSPNPSSLDFTLPEDITLNGDYNVLVEFEGIKTNVTAFQVLFRESNAANIWVYQLQDTNKINNIRTTTDKNLHYVRIYINTDATIDGKLKIMITKSSTLDDTFEKYVGGIPSPSPDFPQNIRVVTDNLPVEYQEVRYIETTGTQYINTNFLPTNNTIVKAKLYTTQNSNKNWFGANTSATNGFVFNSKNTTQIEYNYYNTTWQVATTPTVVGTPFSVSFGGQQIVINDTKVATLPTATFTSTDPLHIFVRNGGTAYITGRLYYFKIYESNVLVRDFIPCYRRSDNVIGLYDRVNNVFYTNQGTGTFAKGNDVNNSVVVQNKNICTEIEYGGINENNGENQASAQYARTKYYIAVDSSKKVSIQYENDTADSYQIVVCKYDKDKNYLGFNYTNNKTYSINLSSGTAYIRLRLKGLSGQAQLQDFYNVQVEYSNTPTTYIAPLIQTCPIHLGTEYLAGIGTYDDEIVGKTDEWEIKRYVKKLVLDGDTDFIKATTQEVFYKANLVADATKTGINIMSTAFSGTSTIGSASGMAQKDNNTIALTSSTDGRLYIKATQFADATALDTYLTSNNVTCYYILETPVEETITDNQLITDLNNMYQAMGYDGTTNITITSDTSNAQMTASVSALKGE